VCATPRPKQRPLGDAFPLGLLWRAVD
jgi:hypothetical protein